MYTIKNIKLEKAVYGVTYGHHKENMMIFIEKC